MDLYRTKPEQSGDLQLRSQDVAAWAGRLRTGKGSERVLTSLGDHEQRVGIEFTIKCWALNIIEDHVQFFLGWTWYIPNTWIMFHTWTFPNRAGQRCCPPCASATLKVSEIWDDWAMVIVFEDRYIGLWLYQHTFKNRNIFQIFQNIPMVCCCQTLESLENVKINEWFSDTPASRFNQVTDSCGTS